jgi:hypothetical protein
LHYKIPRPSRDDRSYDFGIGYRDEDHRHQSLAQLPARRHALGEALAWVTRTMGFKYLVGDFEIGQDEDNLEYGSSKLLSRKAR